MTTRRTRAARVALVFALAYVMVSLLVYRFSHPEKTETELFLEIPKALLWR